MPNAMPNAMPECESGLIAITYGRDISADSGAAQLSLEKAITAKYAGGNC